MCDRILNITLTNGFISRPYRNIWGFWCFFLTSYSCCSRFTTVRPWSCAQSDNIPCISTWLAGLKYVLVINLVAIHHIPVTLFEIWKVSILIIIINNLQVTNIVQIWNLKDSEGTLTVVVALLKLLWMVAAIRTCYS